MRRSFAIAVFLLTLIAVSALAAGPQSGGAAQALSGNRAYHQTAGGSGAGRPDTVWFGGLGDDGLTVVGGVWDFDTDLHGDPLQGWTSRDMTQDIGVRFGRVTAADFDDDPHVPLFPGSVGQLWCGFHQVEAELLYFEGGMGYANTQCQRGFSPTCAYVGGDIDISFAYFLHTEVNYDYMYVYIQCYEGNEALAEVLVEYLHGISPGGDSLGAYNWEHPQAFTESVASGQLPVGTDAIQLEIRFVSDYAWSDEDGLWVTPAGPLGVDDITIAIDGATVDSCDFETGEEGWTFDVCEGIGAYLGIVSEAIYSDWIFQSGNLWNCGLEGNALECIDEENSTYYPPGHPVGHSEMLISNVVYRDQLQYPAPEYNATLVKLDLFGYLNNSNATFMRLGYMVYPFTSAQCPEPHWSRRSGRSLWPPAYIWCGSYITNLLTLDGLSGSHCPPTWDSLKVVIDVACSCERFGIDPQTCLDPPYEGETWGSPVLDNIRVGLTMNPDAPPISLIRWPGHFQDGFGQTFPNYLEPGDVGNANHSYNLSHSIPGANAWHADTVAVDGPVVLPGNPEERWWPQLHIHVAHKGPRQDMIPGYHTWRARFSDDPEAGYVACLMDSAETYQAPRSDRFTTHFHEDDPGFDPAHGDLTQEQEIVPDGIWTPGTRVEYFYTAAWYDNYPDPEPHQVNRIPANAPCEDFEILPTMALNTVTPDEYDVLWPCVLVIDAAGQPGTRKDDHYLDPLFGELGIAYDKFDYHAAAAAQTGSISRTFGGTTHNPGGYGNNGCTLDQLLGYRLIWLETGPAMGAKEADFELYEAWLSDTCLGTDYRKGFIFAGDDIATGIADLAPLFATNILGFSLQATSYRQYNHDWEDCVELTASPGAEFQVAAPGVRLWGSGCPSMRNYDVLGITGMANATGNLDYFNYTGNPSAHEDYVSFAQVVTENIQPGVANWKTIVNGFTAEALSEQGCIAGEDCARDSVCVIRGAADLFGPAIAWILEGADPLDPWHYPYTSIEVEEQSQTHLEGRVNHLYMSRPNPFRSRATLRFSIAEGGWVNLSVFDPAGRLIKTLVDCVMEGGEETLVWDGTDNDGRRVGAGIFWTQLRSHDGYVSSKRMLALR